MSLPILIYVRLFKGGYRNWLLIKIKSIPYISFYMHTRVKIYKIKINMKNQYYVKNPTQTYKDGV